MNESGPKKRIKTSRRTILNRTIIVLLCSCCLIVFALTFYLNTPHAAGLISRLLTTRLHQTVRIANLRTDAGSFTLSGISVANPSGITPGNLVEVDTISIAPSWSDLLLGRRYLRLLTIKGVRLDLRKNAAGIWNYSDLQKRFSSEKKEGADLRIGQLSLSEGAISVNGQGVQGIALQLANLSSKGSGDARIELSFEDAARNKFALTGNVRPGSEPGFDLKLNAPVLSYSGLYGLLNKKGSALIEGVNGGLNLTAALHGGRLQVTGNLEFKRPSLPASASIPPLSGSLRFAAGFESAGDQVGLDSLDLNVNNLFKAHVSGTVTRLKSDRNFALTIGLDRIDLARLSALLPESERRKLIIGGSLLETAIKLSGSSSQGLTSAVGALRIRDGSLEREGRLLFKGLGSNLAISKSPTGFRVNGNLNLKSPTGTAFLDTLDAPFEVALTNGLRVVTAELPVLAAKAKGLSVDGRLAYRATQDKPLSIALHMAAPKIAALQPLLGKRDLQLASGSGVVMLDASGRSLDDMAASAAISISNFQATQAGHRMELKNGVIGARILRHGQKNSVSGEATFSGIVRDDRRGAARFSYRFANGVATIENAKITVDDATCAFATLSSRMSSKQVSADGFRYPLHIEVDRGEVYRKKVWFTGLVGSVQGSLVTESGGTWLEGTANLAAERLVWQDKPVASPTVRALFSRTDIRSVVSGTILGGALSADVTLHPSTPDSGTEFRFGVKGVRLSQAGELIAQRGGTVLSNGTLDINANGRYSSAKGVVGRFELSGSDIAVTGGGGKSVLTGAGLTLTGELTGNDLKISNALIRVGDGLAVKLTGELKNTFAAQREGTVSYSLQQTLLSGLVDPFVNVLPRFIQEATVEGSVASDGVLVLRQGSQLLEGTVIFTNVQLEVPSQKLKVNEINGSLPFSLDLNGKKTFKTPDEEQFSRENYPHLLEQLRADTGKGQPLRIGSVSFGTLNLGEVQMRTSASQGVTKLVSLRSSLYEGALLGTGYVIIKNGLNYRTDLLINGLSLKQFCSTIPKIKDYISGRMDGVISLNGAGNGVKGITGFTELWVREGSGEKMLVSKAFLQKLSGKQLSGFFFRSDRSYDQAEIAAVLQDGYLTFNTLDISNTNLFGVQDLSVSVATAQNRIALDHLLESVKQAAVRGNAAVGDAAPAQAPAEPEFKWQD